MADAYLGYGFDVNNVTEEEIVALAKKYDQKLCEDCNNDDDEIYDNISNMRYDGPADYVATVINDVEGMAVLNSFDQFVMFDSIRFIDDEPERANIIRNESDFVKLISKYFNVEKLKIGNVYYGSEWVDIPAYQE